MTPLCTENEKCCLTQQNQRTSSYISCKVRNISESFKSASQAIKSYENFDLLVIDAPARSSAATLEIAKYSDIVIQPTGASLDDLEPAVLLFKELKSHGIDRKKLAFAMSRVGTEAELEACLEYLEVTGFDVLEGTIFEKPAYRKAQNKGCSITETSYKQLNSKADQLLQSLVNRII